MHFNDIAHTHTHKLMATDTDKQTKTSSTHQGDKIKIDERPSRKTLASEVCPRYGMAHLPLKTFLNSDLPVSPRTSDANAVCETKSLMQLQQQPSKDEVRRGQGRRGEDGPSGRRPQLLL